MPLPPSQYGHGILLSGGGMFVAAAFLTGCVTAFKGRAGGASQAYISTGALWNTGCYADGSFILVENGRLGAAIRSDDGGYTFSYAGALSDGSLTQLAYMSGVVVGAGNSSALCRSTNKGTTWASVTPPITGNFTAIAAGGGKFIIGRDTTSGPSLMVSSDGTAGSWSTKTPPVTPANWGGACYANGLFYFAGRTRELLVSADGGDTWEQRTTIASPNSRLVRRLVALDGLLVAYMSDVSNIYGELAYSEDNGASWANVLLPMAFNTVASDGSALLGTNTDTVFGLNEYLPARWQDAGLNKPVKYVATLNPKVATISNIRPNRRRVTPRINPGGTLGHRLVFGGPRGLHPNGGGFLQSGPGSVVGAMTAVDPSTRLPLALGADGHAVAIEDAAGVWRK